MTAKRASLVLIAEDDRTTQLLLRRSVEKWGYPLVMADDGEKALALMAEHPVRLVISDWEMPGLNGVELCQQIRQEKRNRYIYFIMLTSRHSKESVVAGFDAGADDFLAKPFDPLELRARLDVGHRILCLEDDLFDKTRELEEINRNLANIASTDHLMGIGNRWSFASAIVRCHALALRQQVPFAVVIADVDHFKAYNDLYGHQAGDHVLRTIAQTLRSTIRAGDEIFRYGGEELVLLTPFQTRATLQVMSERLRASIEKLEIAHQGNEGQRVTVSFGGFLFDPQDGSAELPSWEVGLEAADKALYEAKRQGRNRVVIV